MATTRKRRRTPFKGRSLVAFGLVAFVAITSLVIWRRSVGVTTAKAMAKALNEKRSLEAERKTLERDLREAQTLRRVVPEAERRLGLHVASDSQTRVLADRVKEP
ncbi:MAG: hypothetical protein ABMA00_06950 [Gemmatimonas sp.]